MLMRFTRIAILAAVASLLVAGLMMLGNMKTLAAATSCVNPGGTGGCFSSIQAAINAASPGDTINVAAGTYSEQVNINKTVILKGAQAGVDARTRVPSSESIIDHPCGPVQIEADKVVLDGFTVEGSILPDPCFLSGIWTNPGFSGTQGGHQILNNIVQGNISGIELDSTCAANPTQVQFNLVQNNNKPGPGS